MKGIRNDNFLCAGVPEANRNDDVSILKEQKDRLRRHGQLQPWPITMDILSLKTKIVRKLDQL